MGISLERRSIGSDPERYAIVGPISRVTQIVGIGVQQQ